MGSENGFKASIFHEKCDNQGKTLTIVKSKSESIFGGYTDIAWTSEKKDLFENGNSFIFSIRNDQSIVKLKCLRKKNEVQHDKDVMAWFGHADNGLRITDDCD
jgi:hypothetical protein